MNAIYLKNKILQPVNSATNTILEKTINYGYNFLFQKIKETFGKEYYFSENESSEMIRIIHDKFLFKYDPKINSDETENLPLYMDCIKIFHLDYHTYCFIRTGKYVDDLESSLIRGVKSGRCDLHLYIFGKKMQKYVKELEKLLVVKHNDTMLNFYTIDENGDENHPNTRILYSEIRRRDLSSLFFSNGEIEKIKQEIDRFLSQEEFYQKRQLLYKTGILLYGKPGTGKSSLVKALASHYNRSIASINVSHLRTIDLDSITQSINSDNNEKFIILLEDIDTLWLNREDGTSNRDDQAIINKLLQFLDSNSSPNNVIFIATTNHINRLDEALLREGRFNLKIELCELNAKDSIAFGRSFGLKDKEIESVLKSIEMETKNFSGRFNQSKLQTRFLSKIENIPIEKAKELHEVEEEDVEEEEGPDEVLMKLHEIEKELFLE